MHRWLHILKVDHLPRWAKVSSLNLFLLIHQFYIEFHSIELARSPLRRLVIRVRDT